MAVLKNIPGLYVGVTVDGQEAPQYDYEDDATETATSCTKYIEAVSGAKFAAIVRFDGDTFCSEDEMVYCGLYVDGQFMSASYQTSHKISRSAHMTLQHAVTYTDSEKIIQELQFAELTSTDGNPKSGLTNRLRDLGTIMVGCFHARLEERSEPIVAAASTSKALKNQGPSEGIKPVILNGKIAEKSTKGQSISHQVGYATL